MDERDDFCGFPDSVFPARFQERLEAFLCELAGEMTEEETEYCRGVRENHIGPYRASFELAGDVLPVVGKPAPDENPKLTIRVQIEHTDVRKLGQVRDRVLKELGVG